MGCNLSVLRQTLPVDHRARCCRAQAASILMQRSGTQKSCGAAGIGNEAAATCGAEEARARVATER
jgi:hypothetical protein